MGDVESGSPESWPVPWAVWRIDDNGNAFVVRKCLDQAEAERLVIEFTARGHKQTYWAEQETTRAEPPYSEPPCSSPSNFSSVRSAPRGV